MQLQSLKLLPQTVKEEMHLHENTLFDLGVKIPQDVAQYPLHHVTYSDTKFEVATSNSLGGDAFTSKYIILPWPWGQGHTKIKVTWKVAHNHHLHMT